MNEDKKFEMESYTDMVNRMLGRKVEPFEHCRISLIDWKVCTRFAIDEYLSSLITKVVLESMNSDLKYRSEVSCQFSIDHFNNEDGDIKYDDDSVVVVFDGLSAFNVRHPKFSEEVAKQIGIVASVDQFTLYCSIMEYMKSQSMSYNNKLKLIVVYCNDLFVSEILKLVDDMTSLPVVVITYGFSNSILNKNRFSLLKVEVKSGDLIVTNCYETDGDK